MIDLEQLIKKNRNVTGYRIQNIIQESFQLFFVHKNLETIRNNEVSLLKVTIYVAHDGFMGESEFQVYKAYSEAEIEEKISQAVDKAKLINNEYFELPKKDINSFESDSNFNDYSKEEIAKMTEEACFLADSFKDGSINALEIFITKNKINIKNSNGLDMTQVKYDAMVEAIPTWNGEKESVELYEQYHFNEFDARKLTEEIYDKMNAVKARYEAQKPEELGNINVLLRPKELDSLINEITYDLNFKVVYSHSNKNSIGTNLQENALGDLLNISRVGMVKGSVNSSHFDENGTTYKDTLVVENGIVKAYWGNMKFAQYLKVEPTGNLPIAKLGLGNKSIDELKKEPYLECVSMSGIQVDLLSDYIGGEVRLGYYFDGAKITPVTGISISARLSDVLKNMYLSKEEEVQDGYCGPKLALFKGFNIQ